MIFTLPQFLQWCRLFTKVKGALQEEQWGHCSSGTQGGGSANKGMKYVSILFQAVSKVKVSGLKKKKKLSSHPIFYNS